MFDSMPQTIFAIFFAQRNTERSRHIEQARILQIRMRVLKLAQSCLHTTTNIQITCLALHTEIGKNSNAGLLLCIQILRTLRPMPPYLEQESNSRTVRCVEVRSRTYLAQKTGLDAAKAADACCAWSRCDGACRWPKRLASTQRKLWLRSMQVRKFEFTAAEILDKLRLFSSI